MTEADAEVSVTSSAVAMQAATTDGKRQREQGFAMKVGGDMTSGCDMMASSLVSGNLINRFAA